jgi:hypothetical protein
MAETQLKENESQSMNAPEVTELELKHLHEVVEASSDSSY